MAEKNYKNNMIRAPRPVKMVARCVQVFPRKEK